MNLIQSIRSKARLTKKIYQYCKYVQPFAKANRSKNNIGDKGNILIFSEPRGGSTWMAELFCTLPESALIFEPLFVDPPYKEIKVADIHFNQYIPEDAEWAQAEEYFRKLYNREIRSLLALRLYYHNKDLSRIPKAKYFIYKDVNSNMMLPWITSHFNVNPIYIVRHPCAVIASQLKYKHWDYILKDLKAYFPDPAIRFKEIYHQYQHIIDRIRTPEERLAAEWALHNVVPALHPQNNKRWITVSYERLYKEPESELMAIFQRLQIEMPEQLYAQIRKPSITAITESKSAIADGGQLVSWRKSLTSRQIKNILSITSEFGLDFYDESPEPDYSRIYC